MVNEEKCEQWLTSNAHILAIVWVVGVCVIFVAVIAGILGVGCYAAKNNSFGGDGDDYCDPRNYRVVEAQNRLGEVCYRVERWESTRRDIWGTHYRWMRYYDDYPRDFETRADAEAFIAKTIHQSKQRQWSHKR